MYFDAAAFCGHWPYRYLREAELTQILGCMKQNSIGGGWMSSLDAVFYNDPWEADCRLVEALAGTNWRVAMSVDPTQPWAEELLRRGKTAGACAVRLYPCIHDYNEDDERVVSLCRLAGALGLPVLLTLRMEDARMTYLLKQRQPDFGRIRRLIGLCAQTQFVVSNCLVHEVDELLPCLQNMWFDTAGFKADFFLETQKSIPKDRILFGSFAPLQCIKSALLCVPEALKAAVMQENAKELYK